MYESRVRRTAEDTAATRAALVAIHDLDAAERYADRVIVMQSGRIVAEGMAEVPAIFGVEKINGRWEAVRPQADPRSSR